MAEELQHTVYDGAGNPIEVVTTENEDGRTVQGTGATVEDASKDAQSGELLGKGLEPDPETRYSDEEHHG